MKIYTKKGDAGETGLYGGSRVPKDALRIHTYGTIDELNAVLGLVLTEPTLPADLSGALSRVQGELFQLGAELATPAEKSLASAPLDATHVQALERAIDAMEAELAPLQTFILPGGSRPTALLHLARTVSRRAERELVTLSREEAVRELVLQYVNRLSDYFFVCARYANHRLGFKDVPWVSS
jgi:cob(I)alamin adenosyltransferase